MDKTAPTLELRDIHLPDDPSFWPLAIGWWLLILLAIVITYFVIRKVIEIRKLKQLNLLMQQQLTLINDDFNKHNDKHKLATEVSELLNRFVRHVLKDSPATTLTGDSWIHYLNSKVGENVFDAFNIELTQAQYSPNIEFDAPALIATIKNYFPMAIKQSSKKLKGHKNA